MIEIEVENLGEFKKAMDKAVDKVQRQELLKILRPTARILLNAIKARTPVRTGFLKRTMKVKAMRGKNNFPYAAYMVGPGEVKRKDSKKKDKAYYGIMVHNGTIVVPNQKRKHRKPRLYSNSDERAYMRQRIAAGKVRIKPNPWVDEAFEQTAQQMTDKILNDIADKL